MGQIYKAVSPSGKGYVGQTMKTAEKRWQEHCTEAMGNKRNGCTALYRAIRKYGPDAFTLQVLEANVQKDDLDDREIHHIAAEKTLAPSGYNMVSGGGGQKAACPETREKHSRAKRAQWADPETRKNLDRCHSDAAVQKVIDRAAAKRSRKAADLPPEKAAKIHNDYEKSQTKRFRDKTMREALRDPEKAAAWHEENSRMTTDDRKRQTCCKQRMERIAQLSVMDAHQKMLKLKTVALAMAKMNGTPLVHIERWYPNVLTGAELRALRANGGVWPGSIPAPRASSAKSKQRRKQVKHNVGSSTIGFPKSRPSEACARQGRPNVPDFDNESDDE